MVWWSTWGRGCPWTWYVSLSRLGSKLRFVKGHHFCGLQINWKIEYCILIGQSLFQSDRTHACLSIITQHINEIWAALARHHEVSSSYNYGVIGLHMNVMYYCLIRLMVSIGETLNDVCTSCNESQFFVFLSDIPNVKK